MQRDLLLLSEMISDVERIITELSLVSSVDLDVLVATSRDDLPALLQAVRRIREALAT
ncbi:MAG: hypothetical protein R2746_10445 [Acidimicrobiales bacterium]